LFELLSGGAGAAVQDLEIDFASGGVATLFLVEIWSSGFERIIKPLLVLRTFSVFLARVLEPEQAI